MEKTKPPPEKNASVSIRDSFVCDEGREEGGKGDGGPSERAIGVSSTSRPWVPGLLLLSHDYCPGLFFGEHPHILSSGLAASWWWWSSSKLFWPGKNQAEKMGGKTGEQRDEAARHDACCLPARDRSRGRKEQRLEDGDRSKRSDKYKGTRRVVWVYE